MIRPDIGLTYSEYLETVKEEDRELIESYYNRCNLNKKGLEKIKFLNENLNIIVFTKPSCKDAAATIPFLLKLSKLNDKIKVKFLNREGNEKLLESATGEMRVPSFIIVDFQGSVKRKYVEFPKKLKEILASSKVDEIQGIVDDMRSGKYDDFIQEDLIKFLTGEDYNYIEYQRTDI